MNLLFIVVLATVYSTLLYLYLHKKTHISLHYLYKDNLVNILFSSFIIIYVLKFFNGSWLLGGISIVLIVPAVCVLLTILRFYRVPLRKTNPAENGIVSPADGNIIYIKKVQAGEIPVSIKNGVEAKLNEFANTNMIDYPCWLIGINMTPFDVHKNCAPVEGTIIFNKHFNGEFLSLKHQEALIRNERNTIVIDSDFGKVGVVQTASRLVRRIVSYKKENEHVSKGEWFGMIKFGSQVDVILPANCKVKVEVKQQVYAKRTIIAEK